MRRLVLRQDTGNDLLDAHAAADGLCRARIVARQHDDLNAHLVEARDGLAARRLLHIGSGEDADHAVVLSKDQRRAAVVSKDGEFVFIRRKVDAFLLHELGIAGCIRMSVGFRFNAAAKERPEVRHRLGCDALCLGCFNRCDRTALGCILITGADKCKLLIRGKVGIQCDDYLVRIGYQCRGRIRLQRSQHQCVDTRIAERGLDHVDLLIIGRC